MSVYSLKDVTQDIVQIQRMIEDGIPEEEFAEVLKLYNGNLSDKLEGYAMVIKNIEAGIVGKKAEIKRLNESVKYEENAIKRMKENMQYSMVATGQTKVKGKKFTFGLRKSTAVQIEDETLIPPQFIKTETKIIKTDLSKALKNGEEIAGAKLVENQSLSIR